MASVNKAILIGHLGKDPEVRSFSNGGQVMNFSLATSERWKDKQSGEYKDKTEWHNVAVFGDSLINYLNGKLFKGAAVYVEGKIQTRKWQDQSGADRYSTEIVVQGYGSSVQMLDKRQDQNADTGQQPEAAQPQFNDDIPF